MYARRRHSRRNKNGFLLSLKREERETYKNRLSTDTQCHDSAEFVDKKVTTDDTVTNANSNDTVDTTNLDNVDATR
jgi:hypothetical protein